MANVIHVIPPAYLVTLFNVPEFVALPAKIGGDAVLFDAHGKRWQVKRLRRSVYFLAELVHPCTRARFGTAKEIAEDIGIVLECGALPHAKNSMA